MTFRLGKASEANLDGVCPPIVQCVRLAITTTPVDFGVHDGLRTIEEQRAYVDAGVSTTMNSKHLPQFDTNHPEWNGMGHAVDLVPYINGKLKWLAEPCIQVARAMRDASIRYRIPVVWGAVFDRKLSELDPFHLEEEIEDRIARWRLKNPKAKKGPLIDYPHYQWGEP